MWSFKISGEAAELLDDLPSELTKLYLCLRRIMDYKTGFSGVTHRISKKFFKERLGYSKKQGRPAYRPRMKEVDRWLKNLEEEGLIKIHSNYVYKLHLEQCDNSENLDSKTPVQNKCPEVGRKWAGSGPKSSKHKLLNNIEESGNKKISGPEVGLKCPEVGVTSGYPDILTDSNIDNHNSEPQERLSKIRKSKFSTAVTVLDYLRQKVGKKFADDEIHTVQILGRLKDKRAPTIEDCRLVIDHMCSKWEEEDEMRGNLNPTTLFRKSNFYRYLAEAREGSSDNVDAQFARILAKNPELKRKMEEADARRTTK